MNTTPNQDDRTRCRIRDVTPIEYWRMRDGMKAVVFPEFISPDYKVGMIKGSDNYWMPFAWDSKSYKQTGFDLISPWTDELDFDASCLPKWAGWIAMDWDGWRWFTQTPVCLCDGWFPTPQSHCGRVPSEYAPVQFGGDWKDSLHQIVDGKAIKA